MRDVEEQLVRYGEELQISESIAFITNIKNIIPWRNTSTPSLSSSTASPPLLCVCLHLFRLVLFLSPPLLSSYFVITFVVIILLNNKIYRHLSCLHGRSHAWSSCALSPASFLLEKTIFTPPEVPSAQSPSP